MPIVWLAFPELYTVHRLRDATGVLLELTSIRATPQSPHQSSSDHRFSVQLIPGVNLVISRVQTTSHQYAASQIGLYFVRAKCAQEPVGLASNATDERLFLALWIMSTMPTSLSRPRVLSARRPVL